MTGMRMSNGSRQTERDQGEKKNKDRHVLNNICVSTYWSTAVRRCMMLGETERSLDCFFLYMVLCLHNCILKNVFPQQISRILLCLSGLHHLVVQDQRKYMSQWFTWTQSLCLKISPAVCCLTFTWLLQRDLRCQRCRWILYPSLARISRDLLSH